MSSDVDKHDDHEHVTHKRSHDKIFKGEYDVNNCHTIKKHIHHISDNTEQLTLIIKKRILIAYVCQYWMNYQTIVMTQTRTQKRFHW